MGWKSIDDGVGGHEGARAARPGFRAFRPALGGGALLAALAALVAVPLFAAAPAEAKWNVDPCKNLSQYPPAAGERTMCSSITSIQGNSSKTVPGPHAPGMHGNWACGPSEKVAGTGSGDPGLAWNASTAKWDFYGDWIAWTGQGTWSKRADGYMESYSPELHNWSLPEDSLDGIHWRPSSKAVRVFMNCDAKPTSRERSSPSQPTRTDETVETGDHGDDAIDGDGEADVLIGEGGDDELAGAAGDDDLFGNSGDDATQGGSGDDYQLAGSGDDRTNGGGGDDQLLGGTGDDVAFGGRGSDDLFDDEGNEKLHGGRGDDRFSARDRSADTIRCGKGKDVVVTDRRDRVAEDCEHVLYRRKG